MKSLPEIVRIACVGGSAPPVLVVSKIVTVRLVLPREPVSELVSVVVRGISSPWRVLGERMRIVGSG
jgi:hypothetical protein